MLWNNPWIDLAIAGTHLGPLPPNMGTSRFVMDTRETLDISGWISFVGTQLSPEIVYYRLQRSYIACLYDGALVATCVLRKTNPNTYTIETLLAKPKSRGYGALLIHAAVHALYRVGPCSLVYTWELNLKTLIWAYMRGWLRSMLALEYGWVRPPTKKYESPSLDKPIHAYGLWLSDSGLNDNYVYIEPDPGTDITKISWNFCTNKTLWIKSSVCPGPGWRWTGEFIVIGGLNTKMKYFHTGLEISSYSS